MGQTKKKTLKNNLRARSKILLENEHWWSRAIDFFAIFVRTETPRRRIMIRKKLYQDVRRSTKVLMKIGLPIPEYEDHFEDDTNLNVQNSFGRKGGKC